MASQQLQNIGLALQGFSAGLGGQLPQFTQGLQNQQVLQMKQQEQQQAMAIERQKTMYTDAAAALNLLEQGNLDGVVQLGIQRLQLLKQLSQQDPSIDPSDTQRVTQLAIAARNGEEEALSHLRGELESAVMTGQALGVLKAPEPVKGVEVDGRLVNPVTGEVIYEGPPQAASQIGDLFQDFRAGIIDEDAFLSALEKETLGDAPEQFTTQYDESGMPVQVNIATGQEIASPRAANFQQVIRQQEEQEKLSREAAAAGARLEGTISTTERAIDAIDAILQHPGTGAATGPVGSKISPSRWLGAGRDATALIDSLKNRVFVETLQAMRANSPTGGAVGNVSDKEGQRLENAVVALDTAQSDEQFAQQLQILRDILEDSIFNIENAYRTQFNIGDGDSTVRAAEDIIGGR